MQHLTAEVFDAQEHIYESGKHKSRETSHKSSGSALWQIISQLRIGSDVTNISAPAFIMRAVSALEWNAEALAPHPDFIEALQASDPVDRILGITKSLLIGVSEVPYEGMAKSKPYNPIIGERFTCTWSHEDNSVTTAYLEQVSHHPPITAQCVHNDKLNFTWRAVYAPKPIFHGNSVEIGFRGEHKLTTAQEEYTVSMPSIVVKGLIFGTNGSECGQELNVRCEKTDLELNIKMKSKNEVKGELTTISSGKKIMKISGSMIEKIIAKGDKEVVLLDYHNRKRAKMIVKKVSEQDPLESRRVWHEVSYSIVSDDLENTNTLKNRIEEEQRQLRKQNPETKLKWFKPTGEEINGVPMYMFAQD
jgi:hypothetical protein